VVVSGWLFPSINGVVKGKIYTGNHGFLPSNIGFFPVNFPIIQFYDSTNARKPWIFKFAFEQALESDGNVRII